MTKEKRLTLNSDKRKVIADQFQCFYEDKVKQKLIDAKEQYDLMREKAKVAIDKVVRFHQPQEDVDTIRRMISKYSSSGGELYTMIIVSMFNDQLLKLMMRVKSIKHKMKSMLDLTWVETLQEHIIEMR